MDDNFILNNEESLKYYECEKYRDELKNKKLTITIVDNSTITDVSVFDNVYELHLNYCNNIKDISALKNINILNLSYCDEIKDVSELGNVHILYLIGCIKIKNVNTLGNVYNLDLTHCKKIKNVSKLYNVHTLNLSKCKGIKDIGELNNVKHLKITEMKEGIHLLKNLKKIIIGNDMNIKNKGEFKKLKKNNKKIKIVISDY
jgi:hypothetical protein